MACRFRDAVYCQGWALHLLTTQRTEERKQKRLGVAKAQKATKKEVRNTAQ